MNSFKTMGLNPLLETALETLNFTEPTPIQAQTLPLALQGKDILGSAQTGTGKTLAFALPLVQRLLDNPTDTALVVVPTRELAQQVHQAIRQLLGPKSGMRSALLIGGEPFFKQVQQLRAKARIIVGTPGRIIDHTKQATVSFATTHFAVLDEMDRMFDMGFEQQIDQIMKQLPAEHQTVMFSATIPNTIMKSASRYLKNPQRIAIGKESTPAPKVKQDVVFVSDEEKEPKLLEVLATHEQSTIIFVKTKRSAESLAKKLSDFDFKATALHGDLRQNKRERVVAAFRKGTYNVLVATDIAARGIDISHVRHIINFDLPTNPEDYIHRIGRTGRAGAEGFSISLVTPKEKRNWAIINRFANAGEELSDSDRAQLSERPRRSRFGGGSRGGRFGGERGRRDRGGERGGKSFGERRERRGDRPFRPRSEDGERPFEKRRSRSEDAPFEKSFGGTFEEGQERPFRPRSARPERGASDRFSSERSGGDKPFGRRRSSSRGEDSFDRGGGSFGKKRFFNDAPFEHSEKRRSFKKRSDSFFPSSEGKSFEGERSERPRRDGFKKRTSNGGGFKKKRFDRD